MLMMWESGLQGSVVGVWLIVVPVLLVSVDMDFIAVRFDVVPSEIDKLLTVSLIISSKKIVPTISAIC